MTWTTAPGPVPPSAYVQAAFDEEQAAARVKEATARRDDARADYKDAILEIGRILVEARRAMPDVPGVTGRGAFSPQFLAFVAKCGLAKQTARLYMGYARNPKILEAQRRRGRIRRVPRPKVLAEILEMLREAGSVEEAIAVIEGELSETT